MDSNELLRGAKWNREWPDVNCALVQWPYGFAEIHGSRYGREKVAEFMEGVHSLLDTLRAELAAAVAAEREACCAIVIGLAGSDNVAQRTVDAIRARSQERP